jgi:hypothetical protein
MNLARDLLSRWDRSAACNAVVLCDCLGHCASRVYRLHKATTNSNLYTQAVIRIPRFKNDTGALALALVA